MDNTKAEKPVKKVKPAKDPRKKKKIACVAVFVIGIIALIAGVVLLVISLMRQSAVADGEFLVTAGDWTLTDCDAENCDRVVWDFTEIGKGSLTTDGGEHNYNFVWTIKDGKLTVQTDWLYELSDEYEYSLDQGAKVLSLTDGDDKEYRFVAQ